MALWIEILQQSPNFLNEDPVFMIARRPQHFTSGKSRIHTADVVATAPMVPVGMDFEASAKSPDLLDPAIMPAQSHTPAKFIAVTQFTCLKLKTTYYISAVRHSKNIGL